MIFQYVSFGALRLAPEINARASDDNDIDGLVAQIEQNGFTDPLLVRPSPIEESKFDIIDGSRRYHALSRLREHYSGISIPVFIEEADDAKARELSLAAQTEHKPLDPVDEARAFVAMIDDGRTVEDIAAHFAAPERRVRQRIAIGRLPAEILDAVKAKAVDLAAAQAFTVIDNADKQLAVFHDMGCTVSASEQNIIRQRLLGSPIEADSPMAQFVGSDSYIAGGGTITEDLFGDIVWFNNGALLSKLFEEKIKARQKGWLDDGWQFCIIERRDPFKFDKWETFNGSEEDARKHSGVAILAVPDLNVKAIPRLIKPEKKPKIVNVTRDEAPPSAPSKPESEETDLAGDLMRDMSEIMAGELETAMICKPYAALKCFVAAMIMHQLGFASTVPFHMPKSDATSETLKDLMSTLANQYKDVIGTKSDAEIYAGTLNAHDEGDIKDFLSITADLLARHLNIKNRLDEPIVRTLIDYLDPDVAKHWRPNRDFFLRLNRRQLLDALTDFDAEAPVKHGTAKKPELVELCTEHLPRAGWLPKPLRAPCYTLDMTARLDQWQEKTAGNG